MKTTTAGLQKNQCMKAFTAVLCSINMHVPADNWDTVLQPAWWQSHNVITTNGVNDRAPVNQGQLKWFTQQALAAFQEALPGPGNFNLQQRVNGFTNQDNHFPVNMGQLKNVVAPCYDRLAEFGLAGSYPWEGKSDFTNDYAIATVGQVKNFFNFELPTGTNLYYVATDGSNENPGTIDQPFQTISHAVKQVIPGDTVLIRGGTYREQVTLTVSGTEEQPITIRGYGDEYPTIKGSDIVTNWVHYKDNIWMVTNWTIKCNQVFDDGSPLQQIGYPDPIYKDNPDWYKLIGLGIDDMMPGSFFWDESASRIYIWLADAEIPSTTKLEVSTQTRIFYGLEASYIQLEKLLIQHNNHARVPAIILGRHSVVKQCDIQWCSFIALSLGSHSAIIYCNVSNNGSTGVGAHAVTNLLVSACTITNNNYRLFNPNWHAGGLKMIPNVSATIENNLVARNNGHGIWFDGCNGPITVRNNQVIQNQNGIFVEISSDAEVYNNSVVSNAVGIIISESNNSRVFNNTIVGSHGHAAVYSKSSLWRVSNGFPFFSNHYYNNLLYDNNSTYDMILPAPSEYFWDNYSDYNCIYRTGGSASFGGYGAMVSGLDNWRQVSGQDQHSREVHPLVLNPTLNNYDLSSASPCIDIGTNLTELSTVPYDYANHPRIANGTVDIGAYEFNGFEIQMRPDITISTPTSVIPNDLGILTGSRNANLAGSLSALIISDSSTNWVPVNSTSLYTWELDISDFEVGQNYTITIYGTNSIGSLAQQTITLTRGDIGTGIPTVSITTPDPVIQANGIIQIGGTNNVHVSNQMIWSNRYNQAFVSGGNLLANDGMWTLNTHAVYPGYNEIHIFGTNDWGIQASDTILVDYGSTTNHYVALNSPSPGYPYITWETAAQTIQEAVDAASDGDTVYITNGVYQTGWTEHATGRTRVLVDKGIRLQSVNGPEHTIIKGNIEYPWPPYSRCITLDHTGADLIGVTLSEGYANGMDYGGGALILDMNSMSNCIVSACTSSGSGGGVCLWGASGKGHGLLTSSIISGNRAQWSGGGIRIQWGKRFIMENCSISNNAALNKGGGLVIDNCTRIRNCLIVNNIADIFGGGLILGNNSQAYNCTIENNTALRGAGVAIDAPAGSASIYNSIFTANWPDNFTIERMHPDKDYKVEYCHTTILPTNLTSTLGSIMGDPRYLYPYGGDYQLSSSSSCRDMGAPFDWMADSMALNNTNRILNGMPDRGCYEYDGLAELLLPLVEIFSPTGSVSYDESTYLAYGGRNIDTTNMEVTITSNEITNNLTVSLSGNYDWNLDPFTLILGITNTFTLTGWNTPSNRVEQVFAVIRGGIGTGAPAIFITNAPTSISTNAVFIASGTNNMHVVDTGAWELASNGELADSGVLTFSNQTWELAFTNLNNGNYSLEVGATNLWGMSAADSVEFEAQ